MKDDIFDKISPDEALAILKQITKTDKKLKKRISELAEELFRTKKTLDQNSKIGPLMFQGNVLDVF